MIAAILFGDMGRSCPGRLAADSGGQFGVRWAAEPRASAPPVLFASGLRAEKARVNGKPGAFALGSLQAAVASHGRGSTRWMGHRRSPSVPCRSAGHSRINSATAFRWLGIIGRCYHPFMGLLEGFKDSFGVGGRRHGVRLVVDAIFEERTVASGLFR